MELSAADGGVAPALAVRCTMVLKPSGTAPHGAGTPGDIVAQANLPAGSSTS